MNSCQIATYNHSIFEQQFEDLAHNLQRRDSMLRSAEFSLHDLMRVNERIRLSLNGVLCVASQVAPFLLEQITEGSKWEVAASALAILKNADQQAIAALFTLFSECPPEKLDGFVVAISVCLPQTFIPDVESVFRTGLEPQRVAAAGLILANHRILSQNDATRIVPLLQDQDETVRLRAWVITSIAGIQLSAVGGNR